eukprot:tig00021038_g17577.t1
MATLFVVPVLAELAKTSQLASRRSNFSTCAMDGPIAARAVAGGSWRTSRARPGCSFLAGARRFRGIAAPPHNFSVRRTSVRAEAEGQQAAAAPADSGADVIVDLEEQIAAAVQEEDYKLAAQLQKQLEQASLDANALVVNANGRFYRAFASLDVDEMAGVWLDKDFVKCCHPGSELIEGYEAIVESWRAIFRNAREMTVEPSDVRVRVGGKMAWLTCTETLSTKTATGVMASGSVTALNVFEKSGDRWYMVAHFAG